MGNNRNESEDIRTNGYLFQSMQYPNDIPDHNGQNISRKEEQTTDVVHLSNERINKTKIKKAISTSSRMW